MKRMICFFVLTAGLVIGSLLFVSPRASAITYGFVDSDNMFRNAGAFMIKSLNGVICGCRRIRRLETAARVSATQVDQTS